MKTVAYALVRAAHDGLESAKAAFDAAFDDVRETAARAGSDPLDAYAVRDARNAHTRAAGAYATYALAHMRALAYADVMAAAAAAAAASSI